MPPYTGPSYAMTRRNGRIALLATVVAIAAATIVGSLVGRTAGSGSGRVLGVAEAGGGAWVVALAAEDGGCSTFSLSDIASRPVLCGEGARAGLFLLQVGPAGEREGSESLSLRASRGGIETAVLDCAAGRCVPSRSVPRRRCPTTAPEQPPVSVGSRGTLVPQNEVDEAEGVVSAADELVIALAPTVRGSGAERKVLGKLCGR